MHISIFTRKKYVHNDTIEISTRSILNDTFTLTRSSDDCAILFMIYNYWTRLLLFYVIIHDLFLIE